MPSNHPLGLSNKAKQQSPTLNRSTLYNIQSNIPSGTALNVRQPFFWPPIELTRSGRGFALDNFSFRYGKASPTLGTTSANAVKLDAARQSRTRLGINCRASGLNLPFATHNPPANPNKPLSPVDEAGRFGMQEIPRVHQMLGAKRSRRQTRNVQIV